jgi:hypothetical protein
MSDVGLTTIIPWCQRLELEDTLRQNAEILAAMRSDVVVVNCGGDSGLLRRLLAPTDAVAVTQVDLPAPFSRSLAMNIGIHCAAPGVVFTLDADILLTANLRPYAELCERRGCFGILAGMTTVPPREPYFAAPPGSCLETIVTEMHESYHWSDGRVTKILLGRTDCATDHRSACGVILARRQDLIEIGGYRSDFEGWGWEDMDVQVRLIRHGVESMLVHEEIKHVEHDNGVRDLNGIKPRVSAAANRTRAWRSYSEGHFRGTYRADVERWGSAMVVTAPGRVGHAAAC